jgi:hypothetical protein
VELVLTQVGRQYGNAPNSGKQGDYAVAIGDGNGRGIEAAQTLQYSAANAEKKKEERPDARQHEDRLNRFERNSKRRRRPISQRGDNPIRRRFGHGLRSEFKCLPIPLAPSENGRGVPLSRNEAIQPSGVGRISRTRGGVIGIQEDAQTYEMTLHAPTGWGQRIAWI